MHTVRYLPCTYAEAEHSVLAKREDAIQSIIDNEWAAKVDKWKEGGYVGEKPARPAASSIRGSSYLSARLTATLLSIWSALEEYQDKNPDNERVVGDDV